MTKKLVRDYMATRRSPKLKSLMLYLRKSHTPSRILGEESLECLMPQLIGKVIELGGLRRLNYARFATNADSYIITNIAGDFDEYADMQQLPYPDDSVDSFMSIAALEHVPNPWKAIREIHRTLKPNGLLLLIVPFMYGIHGDPESDYYRFTIASLKDMLNEFKILKVEILGNWLSFMAYILQRKGLLGRFVGGVIFILACVSRRSDNFPLLYTVLAQKHRGHAD